MEYSIIWHWQRPLNGPWIGADYRACLIRTFVFEGTLFLILKHWIKGHIFGGNLFWYAAVFRTITAIRGAAVTDELLILDPKETRSLVVQHTYYLPKDGMERKILSWLEWNLKPCFSILEWCYWRRSHQFYFFLIPCLLLFAVPKRVDDILQFIEDYTVHVEGCDLCLDDFDAQLQLLNAGINWRSWFSILFAFEISHE